MAILNVLVRRSPEEVWDVLADGRAYVEWVAGTRSIRDVDPGWPKVDSSIHYTLGRGPLKLRDRTTVRIAEPCRELQMEAHAGRLGTARLAIELLPWGDDTVVIFDEHPLSGRGARWHNVAVEALMRFRNRHMLRRLAELVEQRHPR